MAKTHPLVLAARRLNRALADYPGRAPEGKAAFILNPLDYAYPVHRQFIERFAAPEPGRVEAVLVGMNPGPWGMAQTGVPFGTPELVRDFLGLDAKVKARGLRTHPKRPIVGLQSARSEVSGRRLWSGVRACFGAPASFFERFFVLNYCPLVFQSETGANVTPDKLSKAFMAPCLEACDEHMVAALRHLRPKTVIGVGKWAEKQLAGLVAEHDLDLAVTSILHPSPASPHANRGWLGAAWRQLEALGHPWPEPDGTELQ